MRSIHPSNAPCNVPAQVTAGEVNGGKFNVVWNVQGVQGQVPPREGTWLSSPSHPKLSPPGESHVRCQTTHDSKNPVEKLVRAVENGVPSFRAPAACHQLQRHNLMSPPLCTAFATCLPCRNRCRPLAPSFRRDYSRRHRLPHRYGVRTVELPQAAKAASGVCQQNPGCQQTHEAVEQLSRPFPWLVTSILMGGERKKAEKARLRKGVAVVVATPGRVCDHLESTTVFCLARCELLVLDEADRLLDLGFQKTIAAILAALESRAASSAARVTALLSATLPPSLRELAGAALRLLNRPCELV